MARKPVLIELPQEMFRASVSHCLRLSCHFGLCFLNPPLVRTLEPCRRGPGMDGMILWLKSMLLHKQWRVQIPQKVGQELGGRGGERQ